jgi:PPP family 3-phenylpropionic acid transporter
MVRQPAWAWFAVSVFILWLSSTGGLGFLNLTIKRLDGGESLVGLAFTLAAIAEIPFFLFSAKILKKFGSANLLTLAFVSYTIRFLLYSLVKNPAYIPLIGLMQSISFTPFQIASIHYANEQAPANLKATSQGLLTAVMNFASMAGAFTGGRLLDAAGPSGLYRGVAAVSFLALVVFLGSRWRLNRPIQAR